MQSWNFCHHESYVENTQGDVPGKQTNKQTKKNQGDDYMRVKRSAVEPKEINKAKKTF